MLKLCSSYESKISNMVFSSQLFLLSVAVVLQGRFGTRCWKYVRRMYVCRNVGGPIRLCSENNTQRNTVDEDLDSRSSFNGKLLIAFVLSQRYNAQNREICSS